MTIKRAIIIGTLSAITIGLIAIGIKTNGFKNTSHPKTLAKNQAIKVNAENIIQTPSLKYLLNETIEDIPQSYFSQSFSSPTYSTTAWQRIYSYQNYIQYHTNGNSGATYGGTQVYNLSTNTYTYERYRAIKFNTAPSGNLYTWLEENATPTYNGDILLLEGGGIKQVRKNDMAIYNKGTIISTNGRIQVYLSQNISYVTVNGTTYTPTQIPNLITITDEDVIIITNGTNTENAGYVLTIDYSNTRPPAEQQIPDPSTPTINDIIDLKPLMLNILAMPFTFISQAFDVTLWPNTPYEFNISNFILSIIAISTILFIIRLFTSGFSVIGNYNMSRNDREFKKSQTRLNNAKAKNIEQNKPKKTESKVTIKKEK